MTTSIKIDQGSLHRVLSNLSALPRNVALRVFRIALNAWGGVVKDAAKSRARKRTGLLQRSVSVKVKIPAASYNKAHHGKPAYVIVGPSRSKTAQVATIRGKVRSVGKSRAAKLQAAGTAVRTVRASRYAHLVERIQPFIGPAARVGENAGFQKFIKKLGDGIESEAAKLSK